MVFFIFLSQVLILVNLTISTCLVISMMLSFCWILFTSAICLLASSFFILRILFLLFFIEVRNIVSKVILQYLNELILYSNISFRSVQPFSSVFSWLLLFFWCVALRPDWRCNRWCVWDGRLLPCRILHHHTLSCWLLQWNDWSVSFYLNCFLLSKFEL